MGFGTAREDHSIYVMKEGWWPALGESPVEGFDMPFRRWEVRWKDSNGEGRMQVFVSEDVEDRDLKESRLLYWMTSMKKSQRSTSAVMHIPRIQCQQ